jgi:hypothetical protein
MKAHLTRVAVAALTGAVGLIWTASSFAQETTVVATPAAPPAAEARTYSGPNRALLGTGLVSFGSSYIPSVVVAATSSQSADHHLYVPVVGPWVDLGNRPDCSVANTSCDNETSNKVLLAVDGVFQGVGVVAVVAGLLTPEHETVVRAGRTEKPTVRLTPARLGSGGYGLAAIGKF